MANDCTQCIEDGEEEPALAVARGLCNRHYLRARNGHGGPRAKRRDAGKTKVEYVTIECARPDCDVMVKRRVSEVRGSAFCSRECYQDVPVEQRAGIVERKRFSAPRVSIGTRRVDPKSGYVDVYVGREEAVRHHDKHHGYVAEHRLAMAEVIGRPLRPDETVHHRTGGFAGRSNNDPSNLELWTGRHPSGHRIEDVVAYAREMLALYGDEAERGRYAAPE